MKKARNILFLIVLLLLSNVFTFSFVIAQDGDVPYLKIAYNNLAFQDNIYILYAVESENVEDVEKIKVLIWSEPQDEYVFGTQDKVLNYNRTMDIGDTSYPVFILDSLSAKQMTDSIYAVAYYDGVYSLPNKYSILQYAKNKISSTENENLRNMLINMLNYGASAQNYYNYHTERLANETYYTVKAENGRFTDGFTKGLVKENDYVTVTADDINGREFSYWEDGNGNYVSANKVLQYCVKSDVTLRAVFDQELVLDNILKFDYVSEGSTITAKLSVCGNVKVCGFEAVISFCSSGAEYVGASVCEIAGVSGVESVQLSDNSVKVFFYNDNIEDITAAFDIMRFAFNNTADSVNISFEVNVSVIVDCEFNAVDYTVVNETFKK